MAGRLLRTDHGTCEPDGRVAGSYPRRSGQDFAGNGQRKRQLPSGSRRPFTREYGSDLTGHADPAVTAEASKALLSGPEHRSQTPEAGPRQGCRLLGPPQPLPGSLSPRWTVNPLPKRCGVGGEGFDSLGTHNT